jgi:hypothetical protein
MTKGVIRDIDTTVVETQARPKVVRDFTTMIAIAEAQTILPEAARVATTRVAIEQDRLTQERAVQDRSPQNGATQDRATQDPAARALARREALRRTNAMLQCVMQQSDDLVVVFDYCDSFGRVTRRVVSPIRFLDGDRFLGLCLSREAPRQFIRERCRNMKIAPASSFVMPVPLCDVM